MLIHSVLVFGRAGSPGECMAFARAAKREHERRRPPDARVNDTVAYAGKLPMDDGVLLGPPVSLRPWLSADAMDMAMKRARGSEAVNAEKMAEEGEFEAEQLIWGLHMNFSDKTTRLPDAKCVKAKYLLALPELAPGRRRVPARLVQELMGSAQFGVRRNQPSSRIC